MKIGLKTLQIRQGERLTLRAIAHPAKKDGDRDPCPVLAFITEQLQSNSHEANKLLALLQRTADHGTPDNDTIFKHLTGTAGLFEFKTSGGLRLFCFWDGDELIICTHGVVKKSQRADPSEIKRAAKLKKEGPLWKPHFLRRDFRWAD